MADTSLITPVILAGGIGTRLWPLSRPDMPKQFLHLLSDYTLFQTTVSRITDRSRYTAPLVVCNAEHRFIVVQQLEEIGVEALGIILEPAGRNTAPAAALACQFERDQDGAPLLFLAADHDILNEPAFQAAVDKAATGVADGNLMTFGILPTYPETGYGYIRPGSELAAAPGCFAVQRFVEKPDQATAKSYLRDGGYFWNGGMFLFAPDQYLEELEANRPAMADRCRNAMAACRVERQFIWPAREPFLAIEGASIDYAVLESSEAAGMAPADIGWSDVGSWRTLHRQNAVAGGNTLMGDAVELESRGSYIRSESRLVAAVGLSDVVVVETPDAVLVAPKGRADEVKELVQELSTADRQEAREHTQTTRPWGTFRTLTTGPGFQVKQLTVNPGQQLSLQRHQQRAEHWVVTTGEAEVTIDSDIRTLGPRESVTIPLGAVHRLANRGATPLTVVEVQFGAYLGEDDIERLEDDYGRIEAEQSGWARAAPARVEPPPPPLTK